MSDGKDLPRLESPAAIGAILGAAGLLHVLLLFYFTPLSVLFSGLPFHTFDYALHAYQVDRAVQAFHQSGHLWSYDPFVLSGHPAGAIEDVTSKSIELFVIAASRLGAKPWVAFDVYVLLVHAAMPFFAWKTARLFNLSRLTSALTVLFWVVLWYFDSLLHWFWYVGMISWAAASYLGLFVIALMYRATARHLAVTYVGLGFVAALVTLMHPFVVLTLAAPLVALYARSSRILRPWEHFAIAASVVAAAATTLVWIGPAIRFRHYIGPVDAFLWPTLEYVLFDWLDLLKDVLMTGQPVRTAFRTLAFGLGLVGLLRLRKARDPRTLPLALASFGSLALAYASSYSSALRQTQPYRHVGPGTLALALVAAKVVTDLLAERDARKVNRDERTALAFAFVLAMPPILRTVVGFVPTVLPGGASRRASFQVRAAPNVGTWETDPIVLGVDGPRTEYGAIGEYLERAVGQTGRVVAFDWVLGEYLATFTHVPILGGIPQRNVPHAAAHPLRLNLYPERVGDDPIRRYLEQYAVAAVVLHGAPTAWDLRRDLLFPAAEFGEYRVYRVVQTPSYFERGEGRVVGQRINSVLVSDAEGPEIVLRFHWLETLRCRPNCTVEQAPAHRDPAGFIRVRTPPPAFELYNSYD